MQKLLENLNPEQLAAVTLPAQPALILAGAGSGKTRVLTTRIAWLLKTGQVSTQGILAVTFTNKAAREMTARLSAMIPVNTRGMWIGTFHGLCNRLLRAHYRDAALPQSFQILDMQDQLSSVRRLLKANQVDDDKYPPRALVHYINNAKEQGLRAVNVEAYDDYDQRMLELYALYETQCQREGVVDFAELLLRSYELLSRNQLLREHYQARFKHILVDEFQDTNDLQYQWLKLMSGGGAAVFAVGDDDQSIYAFRGANVGNMAAFQVDFQVQNLIRLEQNYRSHGNILEAANALIANNSRRLGKNLHTDAGYGEPVRVFEATSDINEAQYLVEEAKSLVAEGWMRSEMAILYRSNAQSRVIEHALFGAGIPYRVYGGLRFFERAEIKHAMAYLQLMDNPHNDSAFLRVVNFPTRGIGARSIEQLQDMAKQHDVSLYAAIPYLSGKAGTSLSAFVRLIEGARFETQQMPLPSMVQTVIERSGLITHYQKEKEGADRIENLEQLANAAVLFLSEEGIPQDMPALFASQGFQEMVSLPAVPGVEVLEAEQVMEMTPLAAFLTHASLEAGDNQAQDGQDALQLMTVHSAKGLEFDAVFITGLEEGLFPHENSVQATDGLEEERRLMYVAITRARKRLYLSYAQTRMLHGQTRYNIQSRFMDELPEGVLKWITPKKQAYWFGHTASGSGYASTGSAPEPLAMAVSGRDTSWRIGETVFHKKFGEGVIVGLEGSGAHVRANINFGREGMKLLDLSVAKLERLR
ncbi:UvrD-helicase domain-containing protein [Oxalobacter vibrioformis]|uniref:DNA 3'-5' helicase n=1 Tax=Oxalobacter vibrioformis TaxID=933080 RepID=A0A9E9LWL9_9BURK|nr:UvrD-helicase domain-containing protein [Oxalobacter vibrioformis]WAW11105.1 UvrD-helicase domain-containing protein [Oxalobacter vibrioformis]